MANDTICALATPAGGAIGIIRMSGSRAISIADRVFRTKYSPVAGNGNATGGRAKALSEARPQSVHYGNIVDAEGAVVDEVLVTVFRAPHSYTGEDSVEISCHGSRYILDRVLRLLIEAGCRQARPGEYTQRAFMNGKMDLSQAEAVADLIASTNRATHRMAMGQLRGNISTELSQLRDRLLKMASLLELELDFSDHEELEFANRTELLELARTIDAHITRLASTFASGRAIKQGIPVAIVGKTNVGKSTLLNRLLGEEKAIVSDIHGTTRDVIEDSVNIGGVTFRFIDTAGIRSTDNEIERIGIERTYKKLEEATVVLWLIDCVPSDEELDDIANMTRGKKLIVVRNKIDKDNALHTSPDGMKALVLKAIPLARYICVSARYDLNINALEDAIFQSADIPEISENSVIITNARHHEALLSAHTSITAVINGLEHDLSGDLLSEDLRLCISQLGEIVGGAISTEETLQSIFRDFCVGK